MVDLTRKGILTPEQEEFLAKILDDFFKFKNPLIEAFDKMFFKLIIQTADNNGLDKINEEWKYDLIPIVDAAILLNAEEVRRLTTDLLNKKIDIPKVDEETELMVFDSLTRFIAAAIDWYVQKAKGEGETPVEPETPVEG